MSTTPPAPATGRQLGFRGRCFHLDASGNYIHAPGKFVAAVGVSNLVVVETEDALLITTRGQRRMSARL